MFSRATIARSGCPRWSLVVFLSLLFSAVWSNLAEAESWAEVVRVEEDWELVIGIPDSNSDAPQITSVFSPTGNVESLHAAFEVNHQSLPDFAPGGLQLQLWNGEFPQASRKFPSGAVMSHVGESVHWTQCMELADGVLTFEIRGGNSATWGPFGGQGYLKAAVNTTLDNLNAYNPAVSVENSGVGYAANRVQSLILRKVRLVTSTGEVLEDDTVRTVHPAQ